LSVQDFMTNQVGNPVIRLAAARVIVALTAESGAAKPLLGLLTQALVPQFDVTLKTPDASALLATYDRDHATPLMVWEGSMRDDVRAMVARELKPVEKAVLSADVAAKWDWQHLGDRFERPNFKAQLCVGGVFVSLFVAQPFFAVPRVPFLHALYESIGKNVAYVATHDGTAEAETCWRNLATMWEAVHALLTNHPTMVDGVELQRETVVPLAAQVRCFVLMAVLKPCESDGGSRCFERRRRLRLCRPC
jgi:hypothetical protein